MTPLSPRLRLVRRWAVFLFLLWAGSLVVLLLLENALVYRPSRDLLPPPPGDVQDVWLTSADGTRLHGWWLPHPDPSGAAVIAHGNGGNLSHRGRTAVEFRDRLRLSVLLFDYPGYGQSDGSPSETGCYHAGDAAYLWVTQEQKVAGEKVLLVGESLGGGVATDLAQRHPNRGLVLAKTFTSLPAVAKRRFPWVPTHALMGNRFDNRFKIARLTTPVFIAHGTADELVPFAHAEELFAAANPPKKLFRLDGQGHDAWLPSAFYDALAKFLEENPGR